MATEFLKMELMWGTKGWAGLLILFSCGGFGVWAQTPAVIPVPKEPPQTFTTLDGQTYQKAVIKRIEADRMLIIYDSGAANVAFTNLPEDVRQKYGYDPAKGQERAAQRETEEKARLDASLAAKAAATNAPPVTATSTSTSVSTNAPAPLSFSALDAQKNQPVAEKPVGLDDLVMLAQAVDLPGEEQRTRLGAVTTVRPYDDYWGWWYARFGESQARKDKLKQAQGNRMTWTEATSQAQDLLKKPCDKTSIRRWLGNFITASGFAGGKMQDEYHRKVKDLIDDLDFLMKAEAPPAS